MDTTRHPRRVLFLCNLNRRRSATAERLFARRQDLDVRSAGTSADALTRVNRHMLEWADIIFIMDQEQRDALEHAFPGHAALDRLVSLDIPDEYSFFDSDLVKLLEERVGRTLKQVGSDKARSG